MDIHAVRRLVNATNVLSQYVPMKDIGPAVYAAIAPFFSIVPDWESEVKRKFEGTFDQKITAIKFVRERTLMGLKEAKDWVEANIKSYTPSYTPRY